MKVTCWESGAGGHSEGESPGVAMLPNYQLSINICLSHYNCYGPLPASTARPSSLEFSLSSTF